MSLTRNTFAMKWKISKLTPILKSKDMSLLDVSSYRPVVVVPLVSKLVERVAQQQLLNFLETTNKDFSTTKTLLEITESTESTESTKSTREQRVTRSHQSWL